MARTYSKYNSARTKALFNHDSRRSFAKLSMSGNVDTNTTAAATWPDSGTRVTIDSLTAYGDASDWCSFSGSSITLSPGTYRFSSNLGVEAGAAATTWDWAITFSDAADLVRVQSSYGVPSKVGEAATDAGTIPGVALFTVAPDDLVARLHVRASAATGVFMGGSFSEIWLEKVA